MTMLEILAGLQDKQLSAKEAVELVKASGLEAAAVTAAVIEAVSGGGLNAKVAADLIGAASTPKRNNGPLYCRVSRKGAVSVYGLQQMPITIYAAQWERLLNGCSADHFVLAFIKEWEGKEFSGESAKEKGGKKEAYTATISRK